MTQFLLFEATIRLALGALLLVLPNTTLRAAGLVQGPSTFWPRLTGALLTGLAAAAFVEVRLPDSRGLGLYGSIAINVVAALSLMGMLIMGAAAPTRRGRLLLWGAVGLLMTLALVGIAETR